MSKRARIFLAGLAACSHLAIAGTAREGVSPDIINVRGQAALINRITEMRLETLLPRIMEETGFDMWIIACNEDHLDAVFRTMVPFDSWSPITQILVFYRAGSGARLERLNLSRSNMRGLYTDAWDARSWDTQKKEDQWSCLGRIVRERDPGKIAINESGDIWGADGLTVSMKKMIVKAIGPKYETRLHSGERLSILWLMTLLDEELELYERVVSIAHALIADTYSERAVTPGVTTTEDLLYGYLQKVSNLGLEKYAWPSFQIRGRTPEAVGKYGKDDKVIRRGDFVECDVGIRYLRYYTDHCEWAYVLRPGETGVPPGFQKVMAEGNRLQDIFCGEFKEGLSGNQILRNILERAGREGISKPKVYSHSIGYYLHEPGPLIGLPWEQADTGNRGEVRLVPNSAFTAELSVTCPVPEFGGKDFRVALEQMVAFTEEGAYYINGRQTEFHLIK